MFNFNTKKLELEKQGKANTEVSAFVDKFWLETMELLNSIEFSWEAGEVLPPWIVCIHPKQQSIEKECHKYKNATNYWPEDWYWYGGEGGTYWARIFLPYFDNLTLEERKEYFRKYDLGPRWREREDWLFSILDDDVFDGATSEECDNTYDELLNKVNREA